MSIKGLADNFQSNSPARRARAIDLLHEDGGFGSDDEAELMVLFSKNVAFADVFVATKDRVKRKNFA